MMGVHTPFSAHLEVGMAGGRVGVFLLVFFSLMFLATVFAGDSDAEPSTSADSSAASEASQSSNASDSSASSRSSAASKAATVPDGPPQAEIKPIADLYYGTRVIDNYRWLEDVNSPATQKWVGEENDYTRGLLNPLPGREAIRKRLTELLAIGSITPPIIAGK